MNNPIEWQKPEQERQVSIQSKDGIWRVICSNYDSPKPDFFLTNSDLLLTPHGTGHDYREAFESFIASCEPYIEKIRLARKAAAEQLKQMNRTAEELHHEI